MENSAEAEAVDDQGSGWFEVKKRHRSSAKFSVQSWSGGFSGKNGSGYQPTQSSVTDKGGILRGKSRCQLPKRRANLSIHGRSNMAISSSELNKNDNGVCPPDKSVVKQDSEDSRCMKSSQLFVTDNARVEETQKISVKNKPDVVPKIKWGDLEDDILPVRHENNSQADIKFGDTGGNNLVSGVYSSTNVQEKKLAVSLSNSEDIAEENCKEFSEVTSQDVEVAKVNDGVNAQADALKFHEDHDKILSAKNEDHPSTTYSSGREAGIVLNLQVPAAVSEGHGSKISELPVTVKDLGLILQESESLVTDKVGPEISGEAAIVAKTGMPVVAAENEAKMVELPATDEKLCMEMSAMDSDLILPKKSAPEISTEGGSVVKIQWPVISEVKELPISEVCNPKGTLCTEVIAQDSESLASGKHGPEMPGGSMVSASVEDGGCVPNGTMQDELLKVHNVSLMGEGDAGDAGESKERFRERLWCFLFENLNRAVDELYLLCELECDEEQMKEAILVLEEAASDFKELSTRVKEFENVKRSPSQLTDGSPITLRSDHRRPHALSWEVRRMTTSPHRAEILSSSLEAFKKIQQERANVLATDNAKSQQFDCSRHFHASGDVIKKSGGKSDITPNARDLVMKSRKPGVSSDLARGNLNCDKRNLEMGRSNKVNFVQNGLEPSDANSSRITRTDGSTFSGAGKSKREFEAEKPLHKKDQVLTESTIEKNLKSTDHLKKQVPLSEKDKHRRNSNSWRSMDAWKEKRNWEDILSSPFRVSSRISHSPGVSRKSAERARILHDKLMSPEKKKKTALDLKKEAEEKHTRAMRIRSELENERVQKLQRTSEKLNRVNEWQAVRTMKLREGMYARHQRSESRHEAFLAQVVRRAGDESTKVNEVRFITSLNEENKKLMLRQKLHDSELRRAEKIQMIKTKQKEDMAREEAVLERRKHIEAEKLQRLAETQRKKEEAQVRREEERKASSAAREARAIEQLRRREERAKAQQEEAELLAQKLAERLSESEQRRKFYLEQIRERASTDFRDQSSPLLRRSMNKEGQGRSTPTNNGDNFQENGIAGTESSNLASANVTLQHSLKRRIKKIRQRLMALKYEFPEPPVGSENTSIGYRTAVGTARAKIGRWLQELQRIRQERKGASSIGLITAEMIKFLEGKDAELQASRQAGLLDFIASALPASHTSKPEACQVTVHLLKLLRVVLSASANRSYFLAQNLLPPIIPMLSAAIENYIKIAASLNAPGSNNLPSTKTSVESFESISEVLDNFLWTVGKVIGQSSSDERELQLRDGLLELLIAYQVIHRLRDLFALYDRPQVEGSPFPSSILLSIQLLVVLTCIPRTHSSINWEASPIETVLLNERKEAKPAESSNSGSSFTTATSEDCRLQLSVINGSAVVSAPNTFEDRLLIESCNVNRSDESVSIGEGGEKKPTYISVEFDNVNTNTTGVQDKSQKILIANKDEKNSLFVDAEQKNNSVLNAKEPVAFLLSVISETGLVSLPSLLTAVLLQANNRLSSEQGLYVLPSNFEEVATGVLKVFNNLALLDITFMQRMLARPDLKMEFFHLMGFVLSHCTNKWKVASDQVGLLLLESLLLLGYFALMHPGNQAVLRWGKSPTILHKVCDLPFVFFSDPELMPVLAGTIVATCYGCEQNKGVVLQELSMDMLLSLLRSCRNVHPAVRSTVTGENLLTEDFVESHQQVAELKKCQGDTPLRSNRYNSKTSRVSLAKVSAIGNNIRGGKMRSQKESRAAKYSEEVTLKHNSLAPETSLMLHCRFPSSFIDKAERFFSVGITNVGDEI